MTLSSDRRIVLGKFILIFVVGFGLSVLVAPVPLEDILGLITLFLGFTVVWIIGLRHPNVKTTLLLAFAIRAIFALVHYYIVPLPDSQADALSFERLAAQWAQGGVGNVLSHFQTGAHLYSWILSVLYSLFGRSPLMAQGLNVVFGTLIVWNVYRISASIWGERLGKRAALCTALFPTLVLYSAITMREVAVVYTFTLGAMYLIRYLKIGHLRDTALSFLFFAISMAFHTGMIVGIAVEIFVIFAKWLQGFLVPKKHMLAKRGIALLTVLIVACVILTSGWGLEKIGGLRETTSVINWLAKAQASRAHGRAAYLKGMLPSSYFDLVWQTPIRIVYLLYAPFPWMVRTTGDMLGLLIAALNFLATILFLRSLSVIWRNPLSRRLAYIVIGLVIVFALTTSNYGTSVRHASKIIPLVLAAVRIPKVKL